MQWNVVCVYFSCLFGLPFCITSANPPAVAACCLFKSFSITQPLPASLLCLFFCAARTHTHNSCNKSPFLVYFSIPVCHISPPPPTPFHSQPVTLFLFHIHFVSLQVLQLSLSPGNLSLAVSITVLKCLELNWRHVCEHVWHFHSFKKEFLRRETSLLTVSKQANTVTDRTISL